MRNKAEKYLGYLEHADSKLLGVYDKNIGKGGCTVFADIVKSACGRDLSHLPWCVTFVYAVFIEAYGLDKTRTLLGSPQPGSRKLARRLRRKGRWRDKGYVPREGDLVFCTNDGRRIQHVGIALDCDGETVTSIDGNTVDDTGHFAPHEGGAVAKRTRSLDSPVIVGYGDMRDTLSAVRL